MKYSFFLYLIKNLRSFFSQNILFFINVPKLHNFYQQYANEENNLCGNKFGILIQGPIVKNFTIDTAKYYKELYNNHEVVISTDSRLSYSEVKNLQKLKIKYVNYEPIKKNQANLSSQSHSVIQGINYLKKKKVNYVLKTRSDQKCLNPLFLNNIYFWYQNFNNNKNKILFANLHAHLFWPYDIPDYFIFSTIEEVEKFFLIDKKDLNELHDQNKIKHFQRKIENAKTNIDYAKLLGGGSYFCINYLKQKYKLKKISFNLKTYYNYLAKDFILIDSYSLGLVWLKYNLFLNRDHPTMFSRFYAEREISIYDWLKMIKNKKNRREGVGRKFGSGNEIYTKVSWVK
jgi:hypothetical protein